MNMNRILMFVAVMMMTIAACGSSAPQTQPEAATPTQAVSQPTAVPAATNTTAPVVEATEAAEAADDAAETEAPAENTPAGVSFANDVMPIFENSCVECHGVRSTKEGLDMLTYENLMAGSRNGSVLVPGNASESLLVQLVVQGEMPNRGPLLSAEQIQIISDWVNQGALNN
ncbi:MAG TPA: hypothetical protein DCY14_08790 [Anaerolineae bacterium]|nr:hypothetical protein [Anaerolineae bacterium]